VRIGIDNKREYRIIIDIANPRIPLIYFVGIKGKCRFFMKNMNYVTDAVTAETDGRLDWFPALVNGNGAKKA
jgi:hypothetical protein